MLDPRPTPSPRDDGGAESHTLPSSRDDGGTESRTLEAHPCELVTAHRSGFPRGFTSVIREDDSILGKAMDFGIQVMRRGERFDEAHAKESVWVLLQGEAMVAYEARKFVMQRKSLFDEAPTSVHLGPGTRLRVEARSERVEWAVVSVENPESFEARTFWPHEIEPEYRGMGLAQGTCLRNVRLIFDRRRRPQSNLVIGEVINYPGRWSSYPPHHHAQPEIYHYRFSEPQGYGHGEVGDRVHRLRPFDTLRIPPNHDHAQVSAPGYAMYYLWVVRHLQDNAYDGFEYSPEHTWMLDAKASIWEPNDVPYGHRPASASGAENAAAGTKRRPWTRSPDNDRNGTEGGSVPSDQPEGTT